jgi:hypothetical protein
MVQDLFELAVLAESNPEPLAKINFDVTLNEKARKASAEMSDLLAKVNGVKGESSENKIMRDKAYTLLTQHLNIIRECGRYVFWRDEKRKGRYASEYYRK